MGHWCPEALKLTHEFCVDTREHLQSHPCFQGRCAHLQSHAGLKATGWCLGLCAGNELSMSWRAAPLTLSCCDLATSLMCCSRAMARAMEVFPQSPRTYRPWWDGLGLNLVLTHPMEIVPTESWKGTSGCFMQDEYCHSQSCFTDLVTFPSTLIPPLAVLQALTYLPTLFGDFTCLYYLKVTKLFSLMLFLTKKKKKRKKELLAQLLNC